MRSATPPSSAAQLTLLPASIISDRYLRAARASHHGVQVGLAAGLVRDQHLDAALLERLAACGRRDRGADHQHVAAAAFHHRECSGRRNCESSTMRSSGRERSRPLRSVSRQSSARTVPMPVRIASCRCRICCTCARACSEVIQPELSSGAAILPSSVSADLSVTSGRPVRMKWKKARFSASASPASGESISTSTPPARNSAKPRPATSGLGSW